MNAAHSHLIINHFPIIGLILGLLVLLVGIILKSSVTRRAALFVLLVSAITSFPSFSTGEGAEKYWNIKNQLSHVHALMIVHQ
ncbi:MAG: hypothetical protein ACK479_05270 [Fluviicola sp.]